MSINSSWLSKPLLGPLFNNEKVKLEMNKWVSPSLLCITEIPIRWRKQRELMHCDRYKKTYVHGRLTARECGEVFLDSCRAFCRGNNFSKKLYSEENTWIREIRKVKVKGKFKKWVWRKRERKMVNGKRFWMRREWKVLK